MQPCPDLIGHTCSFLSTGTDVHEASTVAQCWASSAEVTVRVMSGFHSV